MTWIMHLQYMSVYKYTITSAVPAQPELAHIYLLSNTNNLQLQHAGKLQDSCNVQHTLTQQHIKHVSKMKII